MKCKNCGAELADDALFCRECGAKVEIKKRFCRECGAPLADGAKFCAECGAKVELEDAVSATVEDSFVTEKEADLEEMTSKETDENPTMSEKVTDFSDKMTKKISSFTDSVSERASSLKTNSVLKKPNSLIGNKKVFIGVAAVVVIFVILVAFLGGRRNAQLVEMINVAEMDYPSAMKALQDVGFSNVETNISDDCDKELWFVTGQSVKVGKKIPSDEKIVLTCATKYNLYLDLTSDYNLLFNTYDITISLDGKEIGSVANGKGFTYLTEVIGGDHELLFCKAGDSRIKGKRKITVSSDMTYSCTLSHGASSVSIMNESTEENVSKATLEVANVTGMVLSDAVNKLENIGFSNLREEPYSSIWDKNNWIVKKQNVSAGTIADKNEYIQLDCISLDDYFSQTYVEKNVAEIQELAEESGFSIRFEDSSGTELNDTIASLDNDAKKDWVATSARQYVGAKKTAVVKLYNNGVVQELPVQEDTEAKAEAKAEEKTEKKAEEKTETQTPEKASSVRYSTNDRDTVKNGNTGVYSYVDRGPNYDIYYIIDFDEGYVYCFGDRDNKTHGERVKIVSGDLNSVLVITYHDGEDVWSYGLHFKYKNVPAQLILEDRNHYEHDYYPTDLSKALSLRDTKEIKDY